MWLIILFNFIYPAHLHHMCQTNILKAENYLKCNPCLFDRLFCLIYASFCLNYQERLDNIGRHFLKLAVYPAYVTHMCQKILQIWHSNSTVCLLIDWWAPQTDMLHHFHIINVWWFWVFSIICIKFMIWFTLRSSRDPI